MSGTELAPRKRRWLAMIMAGVTGVALLAGCSGSSGGGSGSSTTSIAGTAAADTFNSGTPKQGGSATWTIEKTMDNWNALSANGNTFDYVQVLNALTPSAFIFNPSYSVTLNSAMLASATLTSTSP